MKIVTPRQQLTSSGLEEEKIGIKFTAQLANILSNNIYTDPISAIIRELSCNAYDAHVSNGNQNKPFEVHFPNYLNSTFYIRDFGPGLSIEGLKVFTTYGDSTKNDSNDFIGCMGLGSKTPLAYTDSFIVDSYHQGRHINMVVSRNVEGEPVRSIVFDISSNEPSGIKISFSVKQYDYKTFLDKSVPIFNRFHIKPKLTGVKTTYKDIHYIIKTDNYGIRNDYNKQCYAIMGQVAYLIDYKQLEGKLDSNMLELMKQSSLDIFFNIGEVGFNAGREQLNYSKSTINTIQNKCAGLVDSVKKEYQKNIDAKSNYIDALRYYLALPNYITKLCKFTYKGEELVELVTIPYNGKDFLMYLFHKNLVLQDHTKNNQLTFNLLDLQSRPIYILDTTKPGGKLQYKYGRYATIHLIDKASPATIADLEKKLHIKIVPVSTLPSKPSSVNKGKTHKISVIDFTQRKSYRFIDQNVTLDQGGYYIVTYLYDVMYQDKKLDTDLIRDVLNSVENLFGKKINTVYGIKKAFEEQALKKGKGWKSLIDYLIELKPKLESKSYNYTTIDKSKINKLKQYSKYLADLNISYNEDYDIKNIITLYNKLGIAHKISISNKDNEIKQEIKKQFPLYYCLEFDKWESPSQNNIDNYLEQNKDTK